MTNRRCKKRTFCSRTAAISIVPDLLGGGAFRKAEDNIVVFFVVAVIVVFLIPVVAAAAPVSTAPAIPSAPTDPDPPDDVESARTYTSIYALFVMSLAHSIFCFKAALYSTFTADPPKHSSSTFFATSNGRTVASLNSVHAPFTLM